MRRSADAVTFSLVYIPSTISFNVLLGRIEKRGRSYEKDFDAGYLEELVARYRREFQLYQHAPVLVVNCAETDFSRDDHAIDWLIQEIATHTSGRQVVGS